jgi:colanic acid biosynthesis glycosyl transferase WcaI
MKILYVSQYFPPEMGAPAARAGELSQYWARAGHDVTVLTGFPNHPNGLIPSEYHSRFRRLFFREQRNGADVVRTWLLPLPNRKAPERILNYSSFCLSAAVRGLALPRPDVLIATSPQLLVGLSGWWLARWKNTPFVLEIRDLWPESLLAVGLGTDKSLLYRSLNRIASFLYHRAHRIVVVTPAFEEYLVKNWNVPEEKISVIENGVETQTFAPCPATDHRRTLGMEATFVVSYIGTMGMAQGLETVIHAAALLAKTNPEIVFLMIGEGGEKARLLALTRELNLRNLRFLDQQPREKIPAYIGASDACVVPLKKTELFKTVIPSKMLEFMSCERPVILGVEGQARAILEEARAGIAIEPENVNALADAIRHLAHHRELGGKFGRNGREYILRKFSRRQSAEKYIGVLEELIRLPRVRETEFAA